MEKILKIKTWDNHIIYGVLTKPEKIANKLVIFVHGLTGNKNEHIFFNGAKYFAKHDIATFRFDLYSGEKNGRTLDECSVKTHADDIDDVIKYFRKDYKNIYLVGHSLGGPSVVWSNLKPVKSIILWDPSFDLMEEPEEFGLVLNKHLDKYILNWGVKYFVSKDMVKDWEKIPTNLIAKITKPVKIICAGNGVLYRDWQKKLPEITTKKKFMIIKNAGHCFDEEGIEEKLFQETLKWIKD